MQKSNFTDGSFVVQKIESTVKNSRISAWYNKDGTVTAYERICGNKTFSKLNKKDLEHVQSVGKRYKENA